MLILTCHHLLQLSPHLTHTPALPGVPLLSTYRLATERAAEYKLLGPEVVSTMGNFIDNHDVPRFLTQQPDDALLRNALTWILLADGMPVIYYGTGSQMTGSVQHGGNRNCLWEQGYNESNPTFQTISRLAK